MTACLLDTHAFAMVLTDDARMTPRVRQTIAAATQVGVSAITFYEIGQKVRLGKWPVMADVVSRLDALATEAGFELIPLSPSAARQGAMLDWSHRDPFDRIIAAVAKAEGMLLVSSDAAFDAIGLDRIWD